MIIDFGLNPQPFGMPAHPVTITQRIVTNYYTAKRMLQRCTSRSSVTSKPSASSRPTCKSASLAAPAAKPWRRFLAAAALRGPNASCPSCGRGV
jgi:hypothetical protein